MVRKDLGMVTAYAYAVSRGYTGTEAEFAELMASYASVAQEAVDAALAAAQSAQAAASARDTAQTTVAGAIAGIQAEGQTQVDNVNAAGATQIAAVEAKGEETRESIPDNYTTLANTVDSHSAEIALQEDAIPGTTQTITFDADGNVQRIVHSSENTVVRTDVFTFGAGTITEVRTLASGASLTIVTNTDTLVTTVTMTAA